MAGGADRINTRRRGLTTSPYKWRKQDTHTHLEVIPRTTPPQAEAETIENPCQSRLGTQQDCAGHQERWRRLGQAEGAESKKGCGYACAVRAHMQRPKKPHLQSHPTAQNTTTTPAAHAKTQSHAHNPSKNTMRHLPTDMVESKVCGNRDDKYPLPLSSPQPGAELHRPSPRRKYQTRGVLRYFCAVPERSA